MFRAATVVPLVLVLSCSLSFAWSRDSATAEMGLPTTTDGGLEIRVWLGGGVTRPHFIYRIRETPGGPTGEVIAFTEVTHAYPRQYDEKGARKRNKRARRFLKKHYCDPNTTENYFWCRPPIKSDVLWSIFLRDLMPERLWDLPVDLARDCGWLMEDGYSVTIEVIAGDRSHSVSYGNPNFCCPDVACAIANHARAVVGLIK